MASLGTTSVSAKPVRHIHLIDAVSVQPTCHKKHQAKRKIKRQTKSQRLYKQGKHDVLYPPFSSNKIQLTKRLMRNKSFLNGVKHELSYLVGTWDYSKRGVRAHSNHYLANYRSYLYGNYHYRMGYLAGSQVQSLSDKENNKVNEAKRNRSFWKGFIAGVYNTYGYRASFKTAKWEYKYNGKLSDDVAPPYDR